jgi:alpha-methylacyl-CoA racemase
VSAIEPKFYDALLELLGIAAATMPAQGDRTHWPAMRARFAELLLSRPRDEWCALSARTDACVTPVLTLAEAPHHPHNVARESFVEVGGVLEPAPTPRFSRTQAGMPRRRPRRGENTREVLLGCGFASAEVDDLVATGAVVQESAD